MRCLLRQKNSDAKAYGVSEEHEYQLTSGRIAIRDAEEFRVLWDELGRLGRKKAKHWMRESGRLQRLHVHAGWKGRVQTLCQPPANHLGCE